MRTCRTPFLIFGALLFCAPALATSGASPVYVSSSSTATVYQAQQPFPATPSSVITDTGHDVEGMVYGPDQMIYVCEPQNHMVIRFNPLAPYPSTTITTVFTSSETGLQKPQCGRFTSTGDLLVSDVAGSGVWEFPAMSGSANPALIAPQNILTGAQLSSESFRGAGLTQLNNGDLVIVNQAENSLYLAPYSSSGLHFSTASLITLPGALNSPTGIARNSTNDLFIADTGSGKIFQLHSTSGEFTTSTSTTCANFTSSSATPMFLQFSADDTLYVATQTTGNPLNYAGAVFSISVTASCGTPAPVTTLPRFDSDSPVVGDDETLDPGDDAYAQAIGIALPPTATAPMGPKMGTSRNFNFGFTSYQINVSASCTATVTAIQTPPSLLANALGQLPANTALVPYLGEAGFITVYDVNAPTCTSANVLIGAFTKDFSNPRIVKCDLTISGTCQLVTTTGVYPLGGPLPGDGGVGGGVPNFSQFFLVNTPILTETVNGQKPVNFCGFQFPLKGSGTTLPSNPPLFDEDDLVLISFRLAATNGNCKTGPFVDNASVLVSLAQIDPNFNPITSRENLVTSTINGAFLFHTYFGLLNLEDLPNGTYSVTLSFPNGNSGVVTTIFKIVPPGTPGSF